MHNNRRKARRTKVDWSLEVVNRDGDRIPGRIVNLSQTGIMFMAPGYHFEKNDPIGMVIGVSPTRQIRCVARVVRHIPGSRRITTCGAEFVRFVAEEQSLLQEMLSEVLRRSPAEVIPSPPPTPKATPKVFQAPQRLFNPLELKPVEFKPVESPIEPGSNQQQ